MTVFLVTYASLSLLLQSSFVLASVHAPVCVEEDLECEAAPLSLLQTQLRIDHIQHIASGAQSQEQIFRDLLAASLTTAVSVATFCIVLGCVAFIFDRRAFKIDLPTDASITIVSLVHLFSVLSSSVMVPESYELMLALKASAAFSGFYVGVYNFSWGVLANIFVWLLMLKLPDLWRKSKLLLWIGVSIQLVGIVAYNSVLVSVDERRPPSAHIRNVAVLSRVLMGFGAGIVSYVWRYLIVHLLPNRDRPLANMAVSFVNMIGNGMGPFILAVAQFCKFYFASPQSAGVHLFVCDGAPQIFFLFAMLILVARFPSLEEVHDCALATPSTRAPAESTPEDLLALDNDIPMWRKALLGACVTFSMLWGLEFGGLEVAMVQILILDFGMKTSLACILIACTILAVVPLKMSFNVKYLCTNSWIHLLMGLSFLGGIMLLASGAGSSNVQLGMILLSDILVFPAFSFSWGLCDGIAVQHAAKGGWLCHSNIIMASQIGFSTARMVGSMSSRILLTAGGRYVYALQEILISLLAWSIAAKLILPQVGIQSAKSENLLCDASRKEGLEAECYGFEEGGWKFDDNMVKNFLAEMKAHIPGWAEVIALCTSTVERLHGQNARILSYWIGYGVQFDAYLERGWNPDKLFGINYSEPLHNVVQERLPDVKFVLIWEGSRPYDPRGDGPFDVVQMLWSLHFEHPQQPERRAEVLQNVFESLSSGGTLLLTEKTTQTPEVVAKYHDFKRQQGVSEKTIQAKSKALVGVLETLPKDWYTKTLADVGFVDVSIIHESLCFVTWLARRVDK